MGSLREHYDHQAWRILPTPCRTCPHGGFIIRPFEDNNVAMNPHCGRYADNLRRQICFRKRLELENDE